jgi:hypothetical protein
MESIHKKGSGPIYVKASFPCHKTRLQSKSSLARPYMMRLMHFSRLTWPFGRSVESSQPIFARED